MTDQGKAVLSAPQVHPVGGHAVITYGPAGKAPVSRILVLKLDHLGDFVIGLPALHTLRHAFPHAYIRLVVGGWNQAAAEASGLVDDVVTYDYFPQDSTHWDGRPVQPLHRFHAAVAAAARYDLAVDLRVDEDTRHLLAEVDAVRRCGIGAVARHPYLDIALPPEHDGHRALSAPAARRRVLPPDLFTSLMPRQELFWHETPLRPCPTHVVYGPDTSLPTGTFRATFAIELLGWTFKMPDVSVSLDVLQGGIIAAHLRLNGQALRRLPPQGATLSFANQVPGAPHEFRIFIEGSAPRARLRFAGVGLDHADPPVYPRLRPAALHTGEQLSLLVQLTIDRCLSPYGAPPAHGPGRPLQILVAPLSNRDMRDWPARHYATLICQLLARGCTVALVGAPGQAAALDALMRLAGHPPGLSSLAGRTAWSDMPGLLRGADLVICNNSGIAHLAAAEGARVLAIHSASHQPSEWGPRGPRAYAVMANVPCSPCGFDRLAECPFGHTCMEDLLPDAVLRQAEALLPALAAPAHAAPSHAASQPAPGALPC